MIKRDYLLSRMRRLLADEEMRTYSDYELTRAVDDGLVWLSRHLALQGSDLTEESAVLQDGDKLPADLVTLRAVHNGDGRPLIPLRIGMPVSDGGYRIEGNTFRADGPCTVTYQRDLPVLGDSDSLDLPAVLGETVAKVGVLMLAGTDEAARVKALAEDDLILARRQRTRRTAAMPWRI